MKHVPFACFCAACHVRTPGEPLPTWLAFALPLFVLAFITIRRQS